MLISIKYLLLHEFTRVVGSGEYVLLSIKLFTARVSLELPNCITIDGHKICLIFMLFNQDKLSFSRLSIMEYLILIVHISNN